MGAPGGPVTYRDAEVTRTLPGALGGLPGGELGAGAQQRVAAGTDSGPWGGGDRSRGQHLAGGGHAGWKDEDGPHFRSHGLSAPPWRGHTARGIQGGRDLPADVGGRSRRGVV